MTSDIETKRLDYQRRLRRDRIKILTVCIGVWAIVGGVAVWAIS